MSVIRLLPFVRSQSADSHQQRSLFKLASHAPRIINRHLPTSNQNPPNKKKPNKNDRHRQRLRPRLADNAGPGALLRDHGEGDGRLRAAAGPASARPDVLCRSTTTSGPVWLRPTKEA